MFSDHRQPSPRSPGGCSHDGVGESGLGFYGVRLYEPEYGRFTSVDKLFNDYAEFQPYQYSINSPMLLLDPSGLAPEDPPLAKSVDPTSQIISGLGSVAAGIIGVVGGVAASITPTGVGQVGGIALISGGIGAISFGAAAAVEGAIALDEGRQATNIPSNYGGLLGNSADVALGGDGLLGQGIGGGLNNLAIGGSIAVVSEGLVTSGTVTSTMTSISLTSSQVAIRGGTIGSAVSQFTPLIFPNSTDSQQANTPSPSLNTFLSPQIKNELD